MSKSKREVIAYAITHAPKGVKGGPYTGNGSTANQVPSMALARRYALEDLHEAQADVAWLVRNEYTARVIRIVRARPSEASAVEVLRELVAWDAGLLPCFFSDVLDKALAVLAASGPDPMPVVRAAIEETDVEAEFFRAERMSKYLAFPRQNLNAAREARHVAVDAYRKAGGK